MKILKRPEEVNGKIYVKAEINNKVRKYLFELDSTEETIVEHLKKAEEGSVYEEKEREKNKDKIKEKKIRNKLFDNLEKYE